MIILSDIKVPIAKPIIGEEEINNVVEVLKSGMIAQGPKVEEFEKNSLNGLEQIMGLLLIQEPLHYM